MDTKKLILAVILTILIVFVFSFFQNRSNAGSEPEIASDLSETSNTQSSVIPDQYLVVADEEVIEQPSLEHATNIYSVQFSQKNASIKQILLLPSSEIGEAPVELLAADAAYPDPFSLFWNGVDQGTLYNAQKTSQGYIFSREFFHPNSSDPAHRVRVEKEYSFYSNEYIFDIEVRIVASEGSPSIEPYTLYVGPQIVEESLHIKQRGQETRTFSYMFDGKRKNVRVREYETNALTERVRWVGISDKYFSLLLIPDNLQYAYTLKRSNNGFLEEHALLVQRPQIKTEIVQDLYRVYIGPKKRNTLVKYSEGQNNSLNIQGLELEKVLDVRVLFGWLENILKAMLQWLYLLVPNYGIAIIFLTIIVKLFLLPLTMRSQKSMARMQELNPKIQELRERHGENKQKMNQELGELYRREKVNPLSGCMPMLIQFPFFIAMFGLFNNHFDLRGATFIAGWINDLSIPESILELSFTIPIIGWSAIRGLPFIFLATQLATIFVQPTASSPGSSKGQAAFMKYGLPIFFFFLLYNLPSGLLVYWICSNVLTMAQQGIQLLLQKRKKHA